MTEPLLVVDCVAKSFGARRVLTAGSLRAEPGKWTALLGRNGVGKSTLFRIACGLMAPDSGLVIYAGTRMLRAHFPDLAQRGLFMLPDRDLFSDAWSVRAQLEMFRAQYCPENVNAVDEAAERTGVSGLLEGRPVQLSSGERRRAELAAVLVRSPRCLLADEPYRNVSPQEAEIVSRVLRELADGGCAVVITGHEVRLILDCVDHVTWCVGGTTRELGSPSAARLDGQFGREFLGGV